MPAPTDAITVADALQYLWVVVCALLGIVWRGQSNQLEEQGKQIQKLTERTTAVETKCEANIERTKSVGDMSHRFHASSVDEHRDIRNKLADQVQALQQWITENLISALKGKKE